jgi:predicted nuclease of predicted toxin-antitoxin system
MKILVDENVCASLAKVLREEGHEVFSLAESGGKGLSDNEVWSIACSGPFLLITRDYHFTNSLRFVPTRCLGIIFLRHGNLKTDDEKMLVSSFLSTYQMSEYQGKLVTLSPGIIHIRGQIKGSERRTHKEENY